MERWIDKQAGSWKNYSIEPIKKKSKTKNKPQSTSLEHSYTFPYI